MYAKEGGFVENKADSVLKLNMNMGLACAELAKKTNVDFTVTMNLVAPKKRSPDTFLSDA